MLAFWRGLDQHFALILGIARPRHQPGHFQPLEQWGQRARFERKPGDGRSDDVASIAEVTRRRFARHVADAQPPVGEEGKAKRFAYPAYLLMPVLVATLK